MNSQLPGFTKACLLGSPARVLGPQASRELQPVDGVMWLHLDYSSPELAHWVREESGVPAVIAEALLARETRPRSLVLGDGLLVILRGVNQNPGADPEDMVSVRIRVSMSGASPVLMTAMPF